jgi:Creatinine amidohydrolase
MHTKLGCNPQTETAGAHGTGRVSRLSPHQPLAIVTLGNVLRNDMIASDDRRKPHDATAITASINCRRAFFLPGGGTRVFRLCVVSRNCHPARPDVVSREKIGTHAGVADTSLMLAIDPTLVRPEQLRSGRKFERSDGVCGDPRRSTAERMAELAVAKPPLSGLEGNRLNGLDLSCGCGSSI